MRILLIAYDYPPLSSPQAIRWYYLSRELARRGVELHVLVSCICSIPDAFTHSGIPLRCSTLCLVWSRSG
jgi:hypothetical protein